MVIVLSGADVAAGSYGKFMRADNIVRMNSGFG